MTSDTDGDGSCGYRAIWQALILITKPLLCYYRDNYDQYRRGELRWMGNNMCYNMAAIFTMVGRPVDHHSIYEWTNHSIVFELIRFKDPSLLEITKASNYIGFVSKHSYMLPSSSLDEHRLRSCIRSIVGTIK